MGLIIFLAIVLVSILLCFFITVFLLTIIVNSIMKVAPKRKPAVFISLKHIKERKKQSIVAVLGVTIGICVLIVSIGIANGLDENMINSILSMTAHIDTSNSDVSIRNYREIKTEIEKIKNVVGAIPKFSTQGIIKYEGLQGSFVHGVRIEGIDHTDLKEIVKFEDKIIKGELNLKNFKSILIGKELFNQIGANIGDDIKVVSPENKEVFLKITGVFKSGYLEYDTSMVILPLKTVQFLSESGDIATDIEVKVKDVYNVEKIANEIKKNIRDDKGDLLFVRTWKETNETLLRALALEKFVMIILFSFFIIISGFVIGVILNMLVREKTKDIGILRSVGYSSGKVMKIFMLEGIVLGSTGIISGGLVSIWLIFMLKNFSLKFISEIYYLDKLPFILKPSNVLMVLVFALLITFISSIYPAYKASRLDPVEALRYE